MGVTAISGRSGRFQSNGKNWNFDDCNLMVKTTVGETTSFEDQNVTTGRTSTNRADGNDDFTGTVSGFLDATDMPAAGANALPALVPGAILTNVKAFLDKTVAPRYVGCTRCIVESVNYHPKQSDVAQRITIEIKCAGGTITNPL